MLACGEAARYPQPDCTRCRRRRQLRGQAAPFLSQSCTAVHVIIHRGGQPEVTELAVNGLFVFIGASPGTGRVATCGESHEPEIYYGDRGSGQP